MQDDFGIARSLKNGPVRFKFGAQFRCVGNVAVVGDRDAALIALHREWLRITFHRIPGRRISGMADGERARQRLQDFVGENIGHVAHSLFGVDALAVAGGNAGAFLAPVLQRVQGEIGELRCFRMAVNGRYAALLVEFIVFGIHVINFWINGISVRHVDYEEPPEDCFRTWI